MTRPEQTTSQAIRQLGAAVWRATKGERIRFFAFILCFVAANAVDLASPWAIGYVLGIFTKLGFTDAAYHDAMLGIALYVGTRLGSSVLHHIARFIQNTVSFHTRMSTMESLFTSLLRFPLRWHVAHHSGESLSKLNRAVGAIEQSVGTYIWQIVEGMVKIFSAGALIIVLDKWVALNVFGMCLVTILMMILFNRTLLKNIRKNNSFYDRVNTTVVDFLFNIVTVKTLKLERAGERRLRELTPEGLAISKRISLFQEFKWGSVDVGYAIVIGSSLWIYFTSHRGMTGAFDVAAVYVLLNYLNTIFSAVGTFTGYYSGVLESAIAYEDGQRIFDEAVAMPPIVSPRRIARDWKEISINQLRFSYPGVDDRAGLRGVDLTLYRGNKIALVGPSGSGKSTLLRLLGGMLSPEHAVVTVKSEDGTIQTDLNLEDVSRIGLILPQEPEIFNETMGYNLTFGEEYQQEQLKFYLSLCKVESVVQRLPNGFNSDLAQKGLNLSVGEKQRISLARGLLRTEDKEIILLDEPTSSIDPFTEKQIFLNMLDHFNDRTILTACHRLALVPLFDTIFYVRQGVVEEVGKFQDLVDKGGAFARVWADYQQKITREPHQEVQTADS